MADTTTMDTASLIGKVSEPVKTVSNAALAIAIVVALVAIGAVIVAAIALENTLKSREVMGVINTGIQGIKDDQNKLSSDINKLKADIGGESTGKLIQDIAKLTGEVGSLQTTFTTLKGQADGANTAVATLQTNMSGLQTKLGNQAKKIDELTETVNTTTTKVNTIVGKTDTVLTNLSDEVAKANSAKTDLAGEVSKAVTTTTALTGEVKKATDLVDSMKTGVVDQLKVGKIEFMLPQSNGQYPTSGMSLTGGPGELQIISDVKNKGPRVVGFYKFAQGTGVNHNPGQWFTGFETDAKFDRIVNTDCKPFEFC